MAGRGLGFFYAFCFLFGVILLWCAFMLSIYHCYTPYSVGMLLNISFISLSKIN